MTPTFFGHNSTGTGTGGGGGAVAITDNFNRADSASLGANWNQEVGVTQIISNRLLFVSGDYATNLAMHNTPVGVATQYQKATFVIGGGPTYFDFIFRAVSSTGAGYVVEFASGENEVSWTRYSNISTGAGEQHIGSAQSLDIESGYTLGVTVDGTGNNTVVRVWLNPTGLPISASNWNGDTTPQLSLTTNPTTPADTGTLLGVACAMQNATGMAIDDWFGGSL